MVIPPASADVTNRQESQCAMVWVAHIQGGASTDLPMALNMFLLHALRIRE